jgi:uncharacterized delta-60 repeat protein
MARPTPRSGAVSRRLIASLAALALAAPWTGCGSSDEDDDSSSEELVSISIIEEHEGSSDDNMYDWESPGPVARLTLNVESLLHGDLLLTIQDAAAATIFSRLYRSFDWFWYVDGEFTDIDFTESGMPGPWKIRLQYTEFTGDVSLLVESTDAPPPDPVVPGPDSNSPLLDLGFGTNGRATYEPGAAAGRRCAVDSLGRIVVCGTVVRGDGSRRLTVWRYLSSGRLDGGFGDAGIYTHEDSSLFASGAFAIAVDSIDRVLVAGWFAPDADRRTDLAVLRLTTGRLDGAFSSDGVATFDDGEDEVGVAVGLDSIGRVVVAGTSRTQDDAAGHMLLLRFTSGGTPDQALDGDGVVRTTDPTDRATDMTVVGDRPLVLGTRGGNLILWKFTSGGDPDLGFGSGGIVTGAGPATELRVGRSLVVKDDATLGVAGVRFHNDGSSPPELALWRFTEIGAPLTAFSDDGFLTHAHPDGWAAGNGLRFDPQNRLLVVGVTRSSDVEESDASATLWRFFTAGGLDTSLLGSDGTGVTRFDPRPGDAGTAASSVVRLGTGELIVSGTAFSRETNGVDLVLWQLAP